MSDTGRLAVPLGKRTARQVFGVVDLDELWLITRIDFAHLVMLAEQGLIDRPAAGSLLRRISELRAEGFLSLVDMPMPRGLYLAYEHHLITELGPDVGGKLHTGRSRNDLKATITALTLRSFVLDLLDEGVRLMAVLLNRARAHRDTIMPIYTHYQAAMPVTYGHYLVGVALAAGRDLAATRQAIEELRRCPMGAGAVAGTDLPIEPARTAELLGFQEPPVHAIDAVASRDVQLRVLAAVSGLGLTLSRLATDLQLWSTAEFGFIRFAERLVGGSSAMPQKRNAFLLEHVKAKAALAIGGWTAAAAAIRSTPFTNSIEVGTEAVGSTWPGLHAVADAVLLSQVLLSGAAAVPERMADRAESGFVSATGMANRLVRQGVPFRKAHHLVGAAVRRAVARGTTDLSDVSSLNGLPVDMDLTRLVQATDRGGGPGAFDIAFGAAYQEGRGLWQACRRERARLAGADRALTESVDEIIKENDGR